MTFSPASASRPPSVPRVRCRTTSDIVAAAPYVLGFTVRNSLVLLLISDSTGRGAVRLKLPNPATAQAPLAPTDVAEIAECAAGVVEHLTDVDAVAVLLYADDTITHPDAHRHALLLRRVIRAIQATRKAVPHAAIVNATHWANVHEPADTGWGGSPLHEVSSNRVALECLATLEQPLRDLDSAALLPAPDPHTQRELEAVLARAPLRPRERTTPGVRLARVREVQWLLLELLEDAPLASLTDTAARWIRAVHAEEHWLNAATALLSSHRVWEALLTRCREQHRLTIREGLAFTPEGRLRSEEERVAAYVSMFGTLSEYTPHHTRIAEVTTRLATLSAHCPARLRAPIEALRALAWWARGMTSVAESILDAALAGTESGSAHSVPVRAVSALLANGAVPTWTRELPSRPQTNGQAA